MNTDDYSGAEAVNFSIIKNLRNEFDFYWVSRKGKINERLKEEKIQWIEIKRLSIGELKRAFKTHHPDILHATDYTSSVICAPFANKFPVINHLHNNSPWIKKKCLYSYLYKYSAKRASKILIVSNSIKDEYIFSDSIKNKIINIGNPISRKEILLKAETVKTKKYDICCVARIAKPKNPKKFLDIIYELKKKNGNVSAIWIGKGEIENEIKDYSKERGLEHNVIFAGYKKNPWKYMAQSKLFMLTSDYEGFGLVAFEALCLGLPCIVSNVGGLPSIVTNKCGRVCDSKEDFIAECSLLLNNENLLRKKSQESILRS